MAIEMNNAEGKQRVFHFFKIKLVQIVLDDCYLLLDFCLTIRLRARVFYEQIVNEAQPS